MVYLKDVPVNIGTIRFNGIVDLSGLFKIMRDWLVDHEYEFYEKTFKSKAYPEGIKKELEWTAGKDVTDYIRYTIDIYIVAFNIMDVEVIRNGKKAKLTSCRLVIELKGKVEMDPYNRFGGSKFLQNLQDWYHRYIIKRDILFIYADGFYYHALKLHRIIKEYLEFETKTSSK
ncbi:MAG: hypothetical protein AABX52_00885 [Nanoarchaeota archaeon]